jgi:predicted anti-sigma-YlaC factor YlaD
VNRCDETVPSFDAYTDGGLPPEMLHRIESHLAECDACRHALQGFRELRTQVACLPKALEPERDLWPAIAERLAARRSLKRQLHYLLAWRSFAAAASILIVGGGVAFFYGFELRDGSSVDVASPRRSSVESSISTEVAKAEQAYIAAANDFLAELDSSKSVLSPNARRILDGNLDITDRAIDDIKTALQQRPNDLALARRLLAAHEQRVELLQHVAHYSFASQTGG